MNKEPLCCMQLLPFEVDISKVIMSNANDGIMIMWGVKSVLFMFNNGLQHCHLCVM